MKNSISNPAPFYADVAKHVPPPETLGPCGSCRYWVLSEAFRICHTPQGAKRVSDLIKEGHNIPPEKIQFVSQCAASPTWALTSDDHWCWQYRRSNDETVLEKLKRGPDGPWVKRSLE